MLWPIIIIVVWKRKASVRAGAVGEDMKEKGLSHLTAHKSIFRKVYAKPFT